MGHEGGTVLFSTMAQFVVWSPVLPDDRRPRDALALRERRLGFESEYGTHPSCPRTPSPVVHWGGGVGSDWVGKAPASTKVPF